jgi:hypothetical protein
VEDFVQFFRGKRITFIRFVISPAIRDGADAFAARGIPRHPFNLNSKIED